MASIDITPEVLEALIEKLESRGYVVKKRPKNYLKKTLDVDEELMETVDRRRRELNKTLRDTVTEALNLWLQKNVS
jgi:hypothetical protein